MAHQSNSTPFALIVGGSTGMGLQTARRLTKQGTDVMLLARGEQNLSEAKSELENQSG